MALFHNDQVQMELTIVFSSHTIMTASGYWFTEICACNSNVHICCWSFKNDFFQVTIKNMSTYDYLL